MRSETKRSLIVLLVMPLLMLGLGCLFLYYDYDGQIGNKFEYHVETVNETVARNLSVGRGGVLAISLHEPVAEPGLAADEVEEADEVDGVDGVDRAD